MSHNTPFYGKDIYRGQEQELIEEVVSKYRTEEPTEELKAKVWEELMLLKYEDKIRIPFQMVMRDDPTGKYPKTIEVILDSKV